MRILLDLQACQAESSQCDETMHWTMLFALAIARQSHHHEIWILLNDRFPGSVPIVRQAFSGLVSRQRIITFSIPKHVAAHNVKKAWLTYASELIRESFIAALNPDIVHISGLLEGWDKDIITSVERLSTLSRPVLSIALHDLDLDSLLKPELVSVSRAFEKYRRQKIGLIKKSNLLFTFSESSRQTAISGLGISPSKTINISAASRDQNFENTQTSAFPWDSVAQKAVEAFIILNLRASPQTKSPSSPSFENIYRTLISGISQIPQLSNKKDFELNELASSIAISRSFQEKQLLVDISEFVLRDAKTGIQRVVRSVLIQLLYYPPRLYNVVAVYWDGTHYRQANRFVSQLLPDLISISEGESVVDRPIDISCNDIFLGLDLTSNLLSVTYDTLNRFRNLGVEIYFVVYDILLIHHPEWWPSGYDELFRRWLEAISELSTGLVCISQTTAKAVKDWLLYFPPRRTDTLRISHFHLGADIEHSLPSKGLPKNSETVLNTLQATPTFLMVATVEPRKGYVQALNAFTLLWQMGIKINLVIVGNRGWQVKTLIKRLQHHPEHNKQLFWLEGISDEYLEAIYSISTALLTASEGEGFGLPLIEAAQRQLPIIARGLPVFREVAGNHAFYFEGKEPGQLANALKTWLTLYYEGHAPRSAEMPWLTWKESTQQLLNIILP
ncbi:MAG: hypothetical protein DCF15_03285 [Phormidesmis priestleyi]|uniref:Glycosyl transferase family 1 domain-containing protein n=1 Tax=Phormidesmis priestleyi TaxID=268141 RepID=A0A2W4XQJ4_9CYAN|nr:MAG: hypothetical protein DCF15_03285 [Phormidesmis priestleyi]